jgi:hypothetical protein
MIYLLRKGNSIRYFLGNCKMTLQPNGKVIVNYCKLKLMQNCILQIFVTTFASLPCSYIWGLPLF